MKNTKTLERIQIQPNQNVLIEELDKLEVDALKRLAKLWNIQNISNDKRSICKKIIASMQDIFYIKGVLEKLSSTQVSIYSFLLLSKENVLTLGEIARKINLPPMNAEMELGVLKRYYLVYQRKNRERLTNNLDRYHYYPESGSIIQVEYNEKNKKIRIPFSKTVLDKPISSDWNRVLRGKGTTKELFSLALINKALQVDSLTKFIANLSPLEKEILQECYLQGGMIEIFQVRELILHHGKAWEPIVRKLHDCGFLYDDYYIDKKFVRLLIMPFEIFEHLLVNHLILEPKKGHKARQSQKVSNNLDFFLNLKKIIAYISRRGISLAKSGKIKQFDLRETEDSLFPTDTGLFIEKSQIYQVEVLLPIMRLLGIVRIKDQDVVLRNDHEKILDMDYFTMLDYIIEAILEERDRRTFYEDVFTVIDAPFPLKSVWEECIEIIQKQKSLRHIDLMAIMIRNKVVLSKEFSILNFQTELGELRKELTSVLFYLQLLGLITVEYPERYICFSDVGVKYLFKKPLNEKDSKGAVITNADMSLVVIPEKISMQSLLLIKTFADLKNFDNVYTFQISRQSFQNGMMLKTKPKQFIDVLQACSTRELSQNFLFSIKDWSHSFPLVQITDECIVVRTREPRHLELLLGQINNKKIVQEKISDTTIIIQNGKITDIVEAAEKLELLVQLVR